ncbi:MAG: hypothetical protein PCFJNLEI_00596 [Verrucomicrobiae bacterium]|nr:hypothetical protein [Verrucomicrobiae bacterium]
MRFVKKYSVSISVFLWVTTATFGQIASSPPLFDIPRIAGIVIDGKADDWGRRGMIVETLASKNGATLAPADYDCRFRVGWNEKGLVVLAILRDDHFLESLKAAELYKGDCIEIYVADKRGGKQMYQTIIAPGMDPNQPLLRHHLYDFRSDPGLKAKPLAVAAASSRTADGCQIEVLLPWENIGLQPKPGLELGLQFFGDEFDGAEQFHAVWYPADGTFQYSDRMHRIRLATRPSSRQQIAGCIQTAGVAEYLVLNGPATLAGKEVTVLSAGQELTKVLLKPANQRATGRAAIALVPAQSTRPLTYMVDGKLAGQGVLLGPKAADRLTRALAEPFAFSAYCFTGSQFPRGDFAQPRDMASAIGDYECTFTYYDANHQPVTEAKTPGRYGAVATITRADGKVFHRFGTLYRLDKEVEWLHGAPVAGSGDVLRPWLPKEFTDRDKLFTDFVRQSVAETFTRRAAGAILLAGLADSTGGTNMFNDPAALDRQWWVNLKRKLYGNDKAFPGPFVCPKPLAGQPAPVVRDGPLAEAGMKADAPQKIDEVLQAWAADTDEAFAVGVVRHGVVVLHKAYGTRAGQPMTVTTPSAMQSITKLMTGTLLMMLADQGLVHPDDLVEKYLPPFRGAKTVKPLTIRSLFNHTTGLEGHWGDEMNDLEELVAEHVEGLPIGSVNIYNGVDIALAGKVMEQISGEAMPQFYRKHLLDPLDCQNTDTRWTTHGTMSTPLEVARIAQMILNKGAYGNMRFFGPAQFEMLQPRPLREQGATVDGVYGLGTMFFRDVPAMAPTTLGHMAASNATLRIDPVNDLIIVMCRNGAGKNLNKYHGQFIQAIYAGLQEQPAPEAK